MKSLILSIPGVMLILGASSLAQAKIEGLPVGLSHSESRLAELHENGIRQFFAKQEPDCDNLEILHQIYRDLPVVSGVPALAVIESRVHASCLKETLWYCKSSLQTAKARYIFKGTDCEEDDLVFDEP